MPEGLEIWQPAPGGRVRLVRALDAEGLAEGAEGEIVAGPFDAVRSASGDRPGGGGGREQRVAVRFDDGPELELPLAAVAPA